MQLHAAAARHRRSAFVEREESERLRSAADAVFDNQKVASPERMVQLLAPGFVRSDECRNTAQL
jgi:hypothetical protein